MNRYFITGLLFLFTTPLYCMELSYDITVTTSDNQEYIVPRWQVRESNTLYTAFLEKLKEAPDALPVCIAAPTISYDELHLYSSALAQIDFKHFYKKKLTPEQQRMLTIVAGQHARDEKDELIPKLWDTTMSMKILSLMLDKAAGTNLLLPSLCPSNNPISCISDSLRRNAIISNASQKNYNSQEYNGRIIPNLSSDGSLYNMVPPSCIYLTFHGLTKSSFNGICHLRSNTFSDNTTWVIYNMARFSNGTFYILTPAEQVGTPSSNTVQKLWHFDYLQNSITFLKEIRHTNDITQTIFSADGKYLAIGSGNYEKGQLSLISLELEDNKLKNNAEIDLIEDADLRHFCFNGQSTLLATGIDNKILFWNTQTHECLSSLNTSEDTRINICKLCFNYEGNRLAAIKWHDDENDDDALGWFSFTLYDTSHLKNITEINTIDIEDSIPNTMSFGPNGETIIIGTDNRAFVVDALTGRQIMATEKIAYERGGMSLRVTPLLLWPLNILAIATCVGHTGIAACNKIQLWDIVSGQLLTTVIENQAQDVSGIGVSFDKNLLFIKYLDQTIKQIALYGQEELFDKIFNSLKNLDIFQLYCLYRMDQELVYKAHRNIHRQSLLYKGIKSLPQSIKDTMYNIFRILHAYGQATQ